MSRLVQLLKDTVQFTHSNGNYIEISPELAAKAVKALMLDSLELATTYHDSDDNPKVSYQKLKAIITDL